MNPLALWRRQSMRARTRSTLRVVTLPFPEDRVRATVARYRAVLATTTKTMDVVTESMASGALTPVEALAVVRRHVKRLQFDLAAMEKDEVRT